MKNISLFTWRNTLFLPNNEMVVPPITVTCPAPAQSKMVIASIAVRGSSLNKCGKVTHSFQLRRIKWNPFIDKCYLKNLKLRMKIERWFTCIVLWMPCMKSSQAAQWVHHCWTIASEPTMVDIVRRTNQKIEAMDSPIVFHSLAYASDLPASHWNEIEYKFQYIIIETQVNHLILLKYIHFNGNFVVERRAVHETKRTLCLFHGRISIVLFGGFHIKSKTI